MSEFNKKDVEDFFVSKTENFEKSPPDSMWENIENQIPNYLATNPLLKYFIAGIGLSVIIFSLFFIFYNYNTDSKSETIQIISDKTIIINKDNNQNSNIENVAIADSKNLLKEKVIVEEITQKAAKLNNKQNILNNTTPRKHESAEKENTNSEKSIKYSINATSLKNVTEITFENEKKENIIALQNPTPNAFGFYDIDISKLPSGVYNIFITSNGSKKLHKTETF
jgi:hypothetical protein